MLANYRHVLATPGAAKFSTTGLLARLPIAMFGLGIVLLVSEVTGSYGLAGSVSATYLIANAAGAVPMGRLMDALGQDKVLSFAVVACSMAMGGLVMTVWGRSPLWIVYAFAVVGGLTFPPIGTCIRARWSHVLDDPHQTQTAYALEGVVDEAVFILGPILVTVLATSVHPLAGLGTAILAGLLGTLLLAAQRSTQPVPGTHQDQTGPRPGLPWGTLIPLTLVSLMLGSFFGSAEVAAVAFAEEQGNKGASGYLLALWALGSLCAGLITGAIRWRRGPDIRVKIGTVALILVMLPMPWLSAFPPMGLALLIAGFGIAPTLIAVLTLTEQRVPASRLTEGMALVHTGIVAGVAPGATLAGVVIDGHGANPAFLVTIAGACLAAVIAQTLPRATPDQRPALA